MTFFLSVCCYLKTGYDLKRLKYPFVNLSLSGFTFNFARILGPETEIIT